MRVAEVLDRARYDSGRKPGIVLEIEMLATLTQPDPRQMMLSPDMGNNPAAWVKLARSLGLRAWSTPDGRYLHLALEECDICGGRGMVQLPVRIPLSRIDFSAGAISYDAAQTSRMLPCPQCFGPKAEMPKGWESPPADEPAPAKGDRFANLDFVQFEDEKEGEK